MSIALVRNGTARALALGLALAGSAALAVVTAVLAASPDTIRILVALLLVTGLVLIALRSPRACVVALMVFLTVLGLLRRLLIPIAGWSMYDPLLLVCPAITLFLLLGGREEPLALGRLPALIAGLIGIAVLEVFNPQGGGVLAGAAGLLFVAVPVLWFFIGRRLADDRLILALLGVVLVGAGPVAVYGLWQTSFGLPPWDAAWVSLGGYTALHVGDVIRAFSSFSSSAEYTVFLSFAVIVVVARVLEARRWTMLLLPLLALVPLLVWALLVASARGPIVGVLAALLVMGGLRAGSIRRMVVILVTGLGVLGALDYLLGARLGEIAATSADPLLAHQLGGLADPLNPQKSTLLDHVQLIGAAFLQGVSHPLGLGTASVTLAASKFSQGPVGSEFDISDAFVSFGLVGGILYLAIVVMALAQAGRLAFRRRDLASLAAAGMLTVSCGHWHTGEYYLISPLVWLLIGWVSSHRGASSKIASPPASAGAR